MGGQLRDVSREPGVARLLTLVVAGALVIATALPPSAAHADAWSPLAFVGPGGTPAQGLASTAVGESGARLVVGCEGVAKDAWRGVAVLEPAPPPVPTAAASELDAEVVTTFFGRAPVTTRWRGRQTPDGLLSWPASGEELRRSLLREDRTRGQAMLQVEIRRAGTGQRLVFGIGGLATHGADLAARCGGWGADDGYRRRERGW